MAASGEFLMAVDNKQFFAAMRWSSLIQDRLGHAGSVQRMRCFFQASDMGVP
jgi:hypothetical protein